MSVSETIWPSPADFIANVQCDDPVIFFSPNVLRETAQEFIDGFPGQVTYAVKANPADEVLMNLSAAGITAFDVASMREIEQVRRIAPAAAMHFNNPVRTVKEICAAVAAGVSSYSVDSMSELQKLIANVPPEGIEIAVRFKLPVAGGAYDFGAKFGADCELATQLLIEVAKAGYTPSLTFHPGTQCMQPDAWAAYIKEAAVIEKRAGVKLARLNTGGGFPSRRTAADIRGLSEIFAAIKGAHEMAFGDNGPSLLCEPGRGLVAECFSLAAQVKAIRDGGSVFLNDGVYGALSETLVMGAVDRVQVYAPNGSIREGDPILREVFGPTCDSIDRLPDESALPADMAEGDHILFAGMGAYSLSLATRFNGFGNHRIVTVRTL